MQTEEWDRKHTRKHTVGETYIWKPQDGLVAARMSPMETERELGWNRIGRAIEKGKGRERKIGVSCGIDERCCQCRQQVQSRRTLLRSHS